jgi:hypothetical protein
LGIEDNKKGKSAGEQIARPLDRWRKAAVLIAIPRDPELYVARSAAIEKKEKKHDFRSLLRRLIAEIVCAWARGSPTS